MTFQQVHQHMPYVQQIIIQRKLNVLTHQYNSVSSAILNMCWASLTHGSAWCGADTTHRQRREGSQWQGTAEMSSGQVLPDCLSQPGKTRRSQLKSRRESSSLSEWTKVRKWVQTSLWKRAKNKGNKMKLVGNVPRAPGAIKPFTILCEAGHCKGVINQPGHMGTLPQANLKGRKNKDLNSAMVSVPGIWEQNSRSGIYGTN